MTFDEASKIVRIWGVHMEYFGRVQMLIFLGKAPESLLPFPKETLEEAINIMAEYHHNAGHKDMVKSLEFGGGALIGYVDDEEALLQAAENWNNPKWREHALPALKKAQADWIKTQKGFS